MTEMETVAVEPVNLAAVEARAKAATPGPWQEFYGSRFDGEQRYYVGQVGPTVSVNDITGDGLPRADAEFIAHAREDVPALVAEARQAREALQAIRELHCECTTGNCACGGGPGWCHGCDESWPCSTIRALDAALDGEPNE